MFETKKTANNKKQVFLFLTTLTTGQFYQLCCVMGYTRYIVSDWSCVLCCVMLIIPHHF